MIINLFLRIIIVNLISAQIPDKLFIDEKLKIF